MTFFETKYGFARSMATLANWRERPYSTYAFQHVSEFVPSAVIATGENRKYAAAASGIGNEYGQMVAGSSIRGESLEAFLVRSHTDRFLISKSGKMLMNWSSTANAPDLPHIVFSISKSFSGTLIGILASQGLIDMDKPVSHYLPKMSNGGYGDCPIQHVMDMRVCLDFTEEYLNEDGDYARYRRATLWNPSRPGQPRETLEALLAAIPKGSGDHGCPFHYLSPNSDLLGILAEAVTGSTYAELMSQLLWVPMNASANAFMTLDAVGTPRGAGGLSVTGRDLLAFGELLLNDGAIGSRQIVPQAWISDMRQNGDSQAWANGNFSNFLPGGRYRNQWYQMPPPLSAFLAIGIHGQWLYVDPQSEVVIAKQSSQALPQNDSLDVDTAGVLVQLSRSV
jgi:CubicO group peptidase (beta-lactamase class C family)